ncbi:hypothetical protein SLEP1_g20666 [Rubroshorea leprosula]|uniref:Reverse transcriptase Ty1/copia-type domain-containing protein n=1 Tax=Rubroshorea leprosula TaxID=152421 RepID=A0AAV5J9I9_9ROSI|nr:hypothetical protein SLEP1_g20666 [Rubroshorea leprosula]
MFRVFQYCEFTDFMTSFEKIVTHPATAMVAKEVIEQYNVNLESLKQVILNLFNALIALSIAPGTKPWYFDSGYCNHMSSITAHFSSMSPNNSFLDIYSADGSPMNDPWIRQLLGIGRKVGCLFELNYLHIPDNKMDTPSFPNDRFIQILLCAIELESLQIPYQQIFQACAATNISPLHLWHSQLGHTSVGTSDELYNASPHAPTSSVEDDLPTGNTLDNFEPSSISLSISPVDSTNELVVPSLSHLTREYGINYEETFASVARLTSVRNLLAIVAMWRWQLFQMDVPHDIALFICKTARGMVLLLLYVDDMIITGDNVAVTSSNDGYLLSQVKYASDFVSKAKLNDGKSVSTPLEPNVKLTPMDGSPLSDPTHYRQLVSSLVYLTTTCPNIAYAVHIVSQLMAALRSTHYATVLRIIRYVKGTLFHGLHFSANSSLMLHAYSDADRAGDPSDRRSTTGYYLFLGNSLISWPSKTQTIPSRSSTEAGYRVLGDTTSKLLSLRWLLKDIGIPQPSSTDLYCDNQRAMQIAHNDVFHERTKHSEIDCHFIRHHVAQGTVHLIFIGFADQLAYLFTKAHFPERFLRELEKN